jgi:chemotaxis protein MotB
MSHASRKRRHAAHEEEQESHERWMITYADMLTLLMVLFIVMFAMSQVDQRKFSALKDGLAIGFGATALTITTDSTPLADGGAADTTVSTLDPGVSPGLGAGSSGGSKSDAAKAAAKKTAQLAEAAVVAADRARAQRQAADAQREFHDLQSIKQRIQRTLSRAGFADAARFTINERGLVVSVLTSAIVFAGDRADLLADGQRIVGAIAPALASLPNNIEVDGHTNQLPVPTVNYPSAWELSTARASTVVRFLIGRGLAPDRLSATGFAGNRPLYPPTDPRAPQLNRRVDIVVLSTLPPDERALLTTLTPNQ